MVALKHALKSIARNPGRSILLGAVTAAVVAACAAGALLINSANKAAAEYKKQYDAVVTISPNIDKLATAGKGALAGITPEMYKAFAESDYLKGSSIKAFVPVTSPGIQATDRGGQTGGVVQEPNGNAFASPVPALTLVGDSDMANIEGFMGGQRKIAQGRMYQGEGECIVSEDLASLNHLSVGSAIALQSEAAPGRPARSLTVVGVYAADKSYERRDNEILTSFETAAGNGSQGAAIQAVYYLKSADMLGPFQNELRAKGLPDAYQATVDEAGYNDATGPVLGMRSLAAGGMAAALIIGIAAALLISAISARKRAREIGALRAMGMGRRRLALSLACEALIVAAVGLAAGLAAGALSAKPVSGLLLDISAASGKTTQRMSIFEGTGTDIALVRQIGGAFLGSEVSGVKPAAPVDVDRNAFHAWWEAALAALAVACAWGIASVLRAARFNPMRAYRSEARGKGEDDEPA